MKKNLCLLVMFFTSTTYAQSVDCQLVPILDACVNGQYCVSIQIKSDDGAELIGNSSIRLNYNEDAVIFTGNTASGVSAGSYTAINFDDDQLSLDEECEMDAGGFGLTPYSTQGFDGLVPGDLLINVVLLNQTIGGTVFACPSIVDDWEEVSIVCFEVLDPTISPEINFTGTQNGPVMDDAGTNFNPDTNDPSEKYENGSFTGAYVPFAALCSTGGLLHSANVLAFLDENGNGVFDSGEPPLYNQAFELTPSNTISFTNYEGNTIILLEANTAYNIEWQVDPLWSVSGNASINFSTTEEAFEETFYFALSPNTAIVIQDLDLSSSITRCNWEVNYWLTYTNTGTTTNSGYIKLTPDELTDFVTASPAPDSTAGDTLYWFYEDLLPSYSQQIVMQFGMPDVESQGENIDFSAEIETWEGGGNRKTILSSELICAYDPNDKLVSPSLYGGDEKNYTLFNDSLEYTIRFQNTGNDTAFTVRISDELDAHLDLNTFRLISNSHSVEASINAETRIATFLFNDIYLPDSFVNEPASHGFVKYRIKANEGLSEETIINNTAEIFFDLNPPIITNTVVNTMVETLPNLAILAVSPTDLDFGVIEIGATSTQMLLIQNAGDFDLEIYEIFSESNDFMVSNEVYTIAGGSEISIPVTFTPTEELPYLASLTLLSNGGDFTVNLQGTGSIDAGINDLDWRLSVAPNPSQGVFELNWLDKGALQNASLQVYDLSGKIVLSQEMNGNNGLLNLTGQAKGVYYLHLQSEQNSIVKKLLIQ